MKIIYATNGDEIKVSDCDFLFLCGYNWSRNKLEDIIVVTTEKYGIINKYMEKSTLVYFTVNES